MPRGPLPMRAAHEGRDWRVVHPFPLEQTALPRRGSAAVPGREPSRGAAGASATPVRPVLRAGKANGAGLYDALAIGRFIHHGASQAYARL
jgi:hypothetical protein